MNIEEQKDPAQVPEDHKGHLHIFVEDGVLNVEDNTFQSAVDVDSLKAVSYNKKESLLNIFLQNESAPFYSLTINDPVEGGLIYGQILKILKTL